MFISAHNYLSIFILFFCSKVWIFPLPHTVSVCLVLLLCLFLSLIFDWWSNLSWAFWITARLSLWRVIPLWDLYFLIGSNMTNPQTHSHRRIHRSFRFHTCYLKVFFSMSKLTPLLFSGSVCFLFACHLVWVTPKINPFRQWSVRNIEVKIN